MADIEDYPVCPGVALIISVKAFKTEQTRLGARNDFIFLKSTFTVSGFKTFPAREKLDWSLPEFIYSLEHSVRSFHDKAFQSGITLSDGTYVSLPILRAILARQETLRNRPKVIVIQACRGNTCMTREGPKLSSFVPSIDSPADPWGNTMGIASCVQTRTSYSSNFGSIFIMHFCNELLSGLLRNAGCTVQDVKEGVVRAMMGIREFDSRETVYTTPEVFCDNLKGALCLKPTNREAVEKWRQVINYAISKMPREVEAIEEIPQTPDVVDENDSLRTLLDPKMVDLLSFGKTVEIGKEAASPKEPYIVRHLAQIGESTAEPETGEAAWLRSKSKTFLEEEIIMKAKRDRKHAIVSAPPGAGKSSLALSMCSRVKDQQPAWWVGKCDLKDKMTALGKYKEQRSLRGEESRMDFGLTELEYKLLWELFNVEKVEQRLIKDRLVGRTGHVVFIIDSYDEIAHMYGSEFEAFIKPLAKLNVCVCVTTREHLLERAKSALEGHLAFRLEMLDDNEQIDLLVKLWQQSKTGEPESLRSEAEKLRRKLPRMFCANPLHLYMISQIDYSSIEASEMTLCEMYNKFVETKFDRYWREAKFDPRTEAEKNNKGMREDLTQIAIWHLLGKSHEWNSDEDRTLLLKRVQERNVGFVFQQDQGHPRFVHESYAEYFLCQQVYERLRSCEEISDIMVEHRFGQVRRFLDGRLKSDPNLPIPLNVLPPGTKEDFLSIPVREGLETLSLYVWKYRTCFSNETQQAAFNYAVHHCLLPVVEQAIQDGVDVNKPVDGRRALEYGLKGSKARQLSVLRALIRGGYQFHSMAYYHRPLLRSFIQSGTYLEVIALLIDQGCDVNAKTRTDKTALNSAARRGNVELAKLLIEKGCDVNAVTYIDKSALHIAARWGHAAVVKLLIENGCDVNAVTRTGRTALGLAAWFGHNDVVELLQQPLVKAAGVNSAGM